MPRLLLPLFAAGLAFLPGWAFAHEPGAQGGGRLHFAHPLISETPSPDTKLRLDYLFENRTGDAAAESHTVNLEAEYAFTPSLSVEANLPYTFLNPDSGANERAIDNAEIALKYANFAFAQRGLLVGGGLELGLPTGDDSEGIGSNNILDIEPFLDFGYRRDALEVVGFLSAGFPTNKNGEDEADSELGWNLSFLFHATERVSTMLEFDGEEINGGEEDGISIVNVTPGIKFAPLASDRNFKIGAGVSFPLTDDREFHTRAIVSLFQHF